MSILMNQQWQINQMVPNIISVELSNPNLGGIANQIGNIVQQKTQQELGAVLEYVFDVTRAPFNPAALENVIALVVVGVIAEELWRTGNRHMLESGRYIESLNWLADIRQNIQRMSQQAASYMAPGYGGGGYGYNPGMAASAPPMGISSGAFVNNNNYARPNNVGSSIGVGLSLNNNRDSSMNKNDHLPAHVQVEEKNFTHFVSEPITAPSTASAVSAVIEETVVADAPKYNRIPVVNKSDTCYTNINCSVSTVVFTLVKETRTKPVLVTAEESRYVPAYKPSEEIADQLRNIAELQTAEDMYEELFAMSKEMPIPGVLGWLDNRISRLIERVLEFRFGKPGIEIPSYSEEREGINNWLVKQGGTIYSDIQEIIHAELRNLLGKVEFSEVITKESDQVVNFIDSTTMELMLFLPWQLRVNFNKNLKRNKVYVENIAEEQLFDILDQCWEIMDDDFCPSIIVTDTANIRYRVWKIGSLKMHASEYHFEHLGF